MENTTKDYTHINGWGVDADPKNEPTYPMKHYNGDDHNRINWVRPALQPQTVEILHSIERPNLTAVFGTSVPPSGLSGVIRRYAFKNFSENEYGHWLPLLLADRINVVEGMIDDLKHGHIPNIFAEKGLKAEWKFNRKGFVTKIATGVVLTGMVLYFNQKKKKALQD